MSIPPLGKDTPKVKNQLTESDIRAGRDFNLGDTNYIYHLGGQGTAVLIAIVLSAVLFILYLSSLDETKELEPMHTDKAKSLVQQEKDSTSTDSAYTPRLYPESKPDDEVRNNEVDRISQQLSCAYITVNCDSKSFVNVIRDFSNRLLRESSLCVTTQNDRAGYELTAKLDTNTTSLNFGPSTRSIDFSLHYELINLKSNGRSSQVASYYSKTYYLASEDSGLIRKALTDWLKDLQVTDDLFSFDT
ncbi:hypothetical protein CEQ90_05195 [Lewinellaceae bacterium SD302]|nr:hypothetical protein CEQ90_05195 [Lewinellaceae bacterium SD302]